MAKRRPPRILKWREHWTLFYFDHTSGKEKRIRCETLGAETAEGRRDANGNVVYPTTEISLTKLGLTSHEARREWAIAKSKQLMRTEANAEEGVVETVATKLNEAIECYLQSCRDRLREHTVAEYESSARQFGNWLRQQGVRHTQAITIATLRDFRDHLLGAKRRVSAKQGRRGETIASDARKSPASINHEIRHVKAMLNDWRTREWLPNLSSDNIRDGLKTVKEPRPRPEYLGPEALQKLLNACVRHDAETFALTREEKAAGIVEGNGRTLRYEPMGPFVAATLLTGMRVGEAMALQWGDVNLDALDNHGRQVGEIVLRPTATKTHTERAVDLSVSPACRAILAALKLQSKKGEPFVFGGKNVPARSRVEAARKRLIEDFGAPEFDWQKLRQTCGTYLTNAPGIFGAASAYQSARQLGHSVQVAERHYLGLVRGIPREAHTLDEAMQIADLLRNVIATIGIRISSWLSRINSRAWAFFQIRQFLARHMLLVGIAAQKAVAGAVRVHVQPRDAKVLHRRLAHANARLLKQKLGPLCL